MKQKRSFIIILLLIGLGLLGVGGYFLFSNHPSTEKKEEGPIYNTHDTFIQDLYEKVHQTDGISNTYDFYYYQQESKVEDFSNDYLSNLALSKLIVDKGNPPQSFSKEQLKTFLNSSFGKNIKWSPSEIETCIHYLYDSNTETYNLENATCTKETFPKKQALLLSAEKQKDNTILLTEVVAFEKNGQMYSEPDYQTAITSSENFSLKDSNLDLFPRYLFTFQQEKEDYVLTKVVREEKNTIKKEIENQG